MRELGFALFTLMGLLIACGDDDDNGRTASRSGPTCVVKKPTCDIEATSCLESLLDLAACVRGDDSGPLPAVQRITSTELADELRSEANDMGLGPTPWDVLLPKLRLLPAGENTIESSINVISTSVAAYYSSKDKDITIVTDSDVEDDADKMYVMLHELTHYLQDRTSDLEALQDRAGDSSDERVSLDALVEGEAVVNSTNALILLMSIAPRAFRWEAFFNSLDQSLFDEVSHSNSPLLAATQFLPYSIGGRYVQRISSDYGRSGVDDLFEEWPRAFCDWMTASTLDPDETLHEPLDCAPPLAPEGFSLYELESFGSAGAFALLAAAGEIDRKLAASLRADAFAVYVDGAGPNEPSNAPTIGVWRLRFDSSSTSADFLKAIAPLGLETRRFDEELVIRVSSAAGSAVLAGVALEACPKLEELKPMLPESSLPSAALKRLFH